VYQWIRWSLELAPSPIGLDVSREWDHGVSSFVAGFCQ